MGIVIWALWVPLPVSVLLLVAGPLARRSPPRQAAPALAVAASLTAVATLLSCVLLVGLALVRLPALGPLIAPRSAAGAAHVPGAASAAAAGALLLTALALTGSGLRRHLRERRAAAALAPGGAELVVLRDSRPAAYAVGGWPGRGQVIATTAMLAALSPPERQALLAHERSHLRRGHHHLVLVGQLAALVNPMLRRTATDIGYLTERDADETAAHAVGDRQLVAQALGHAALANHPELEPAPATARLAFHHRDVVPRVRALLEPEPPLGLLAVVTVTGLLTLVVLLAAGAADSLHDADRLLELLRAP